jgi:hypothetical protein
MSENREKELKDEELDKVSGGVRADTLRPEAQHEAANHLSGIHPDAGGIPGGSSGVKKV